MLRSPIKLNPYKSKEYGPRQYENKVSQSKKKLVVRRVPRVESKAREPIAAETAIVPTSIDEILVLNKVSDIQW